MSNDRYNRKRQARHGGKRKRRKPQYNKHGILMQGDRQPRRKLFPGERIKEDE